MARASGGVLGLPNLRFGVFMPCGVSEGDAFALSVLLLRQVLTGRCLMMGAWGACRVPGIGRMWHVSKVQAEISRG